MSILSVVLNNTNLDDVNFDDDSGDDDYDDDGDDNETIIHVSLMASHYILKQCKALKNIKANNTSSMASYKIVGLVHTKR